HLALSRGPADDRGGVGEAALDPARAAGHRQAPGTGADRAAPQAAADTGRHRTLQLRERDRPGLRRALLPVPAQGVPRTPPSLTGAHLSADAPITWLQ